MARPLSYGVATGCDDSASVSNVELRMPSGRSTSVRMYSANGRHERRDMLVRRILMHARSRKASRVAEQSANGVAIRIERRCRKMPATQISLDGIIEADASLLHHPQHAPRGAR